MSSQATSPATSPAAATPTTAAEAAPLTPAQQADQCSRMTRLIAKVLSEQLISCPEIAHSMAAKVSAGIIREMGGQRFYVPLRDQRAGLKDHGHIEAALLQHITPTQLAQGMTLPTMAVRQVATNTAASHRTVYRVLDRLRRQAGFLPARP